MRRSVGSISELGKDRYKVTVTVGVDPETGRQRRKSKTVRGSKRKAEAVLQMMLRECGDTSDSDVTISEYAELRFIPHLRAELANGHYKLNTVENHESRLRRHILPQIGDIRFSELRTSHVRMCQDAAPTDGLRVEVRKTLSILFREAAYDELVDHNPVNSVRPPKPSTYEPMVLDMEDIEVYLWHFRDTRAEALVLLALGGAYRRGELAALDVDDIDLDSGWVTVDDTYVESSHDVIHGTRKNKKALTNRLPSFVVERLRDILPESGPVFQRADGGRMRPSSISQMYERIRDTLPDGVPRITLKNLRHTALSAAFDATGSVDRVAGHGGHTKKVSEKHYIRQHEDQEIRLSDDLDAFYREALRLPKTGDSDGISTF